MATNNEVGINVRSSRKLRDDFRRRCMKQKLVPAAALRNMMQAFIDGKITINSVEQK